MKETVREAPGSGTLADRFRMWFAHERDCNAKIVQMLESVPASRRGDPAFVKARGKAPGGTADAILPVATANIYAELAPQLAPRGVRVSALCPGPVRTGFQKRAGVASELNAGMVVSVEDVARAGYDGLMAGRAIVLPGFPMKALVLAVRLLPRSFVVRMIHRSQRRRKTA